jgi:hypothetical protein
MMSKNPINKTLISSVIKTSQKIEGYISAPTGTVQRAKELKQKYGIKVSTKK